MGIGYYRMQRGWMDDPYYKDEPYTEREAWIYFIENAAFKEGVVNFKGRGVRVYRGQLPTSYRKLMDKFQWSQQRLAGYVSRGVSDGRLEAKTDTGFLIITICNYDKYQGALINTDTQTDTPTDTVTTTPITTNRNKVKKDNKDIYTCDFEAFWAAYPRKKEKKRAAEAFRVAIRKTDLQTMLAKVAEYTSQIKSENTEERYIKHAASWLNGEGWEDTYKPTYQPPKPKRDLFWEAIG